MNIMPMMRADGSINYGSNAYPVIYQSVATPSSHIRGYNELISNIGPPDLVDNATGGIAIWSGSTLRSRGFPYLQRVEILDEKVVSTRPKPHISNMYIWFRVPLTPEKLQNVLEMSTDMYYDRKKELLIVRSGDLYTAIAQAVLVGLYAIGRLSYYQIVSDSLHLRYYNMVHKSKMRRVICTLAKYIGGKSRG